MRYRFMRFPQGKAKAVTLSYDDNVVENIRFSDVITKCGLKCTFNLNSSNLNGNFNKENIEEYVLSRGHELAVHGEFHRAPGLIRPIEGIQDILNCRIAFEKEFGRIIRGMAYPDSGIRKLLHGNDYETIRNYLKNIDIAYCRTLGEDNKNFNLPEDWYAWMPTAHHTNPEILDMAKEFTELNPKSGYIAGRNSRLFYMWGHSYEFSRSDNWELLVEICKIISNHEDIWYATNMEIYEYTKAYESLVYSADGTIVYNPTLFTIWFDLDEDSYQIKPGETLKL